MAKFMKVLTSPFGVADAPAFMMGVDIAADQKSCLFLIHRIYSTCQFGPLGNLTLFRIYRRNVIVWLDEKGLGFYFLVTFDGAVAIQGSFNFAMVGSLLSNFRFWCCICFFFTLLNHFNYHLTEFFSSLISSFRLLFCVLICLTLTHKGHLQITWSDELHRLRFINTWSVVKSYSAQKSFDVARPSRYFFVLFY